MATKTKNTVTQELFTPLSLSDLNPHEFEAWLTKTDQDTDLVLSIIKHGPFCFHLRKWAKIAVPHPLTPAMSDEEFHALKQSIRIHGVQEVISINERGVVIDGYHRMRALWEIANEGDSIPNPHIRFVRFHDKESEGKFVLLKNLCRRHLTLDQRRQSAIAFLRIGHRGTDNFIGSLCGISGETVTKIRHVLESKPPSEGGIPQLSERTGKNGKKYKVQTRPVAKKASFKQSDAAQPMDLDSSNDALEDGNTDGPKKVRKPMKKASVQTTSPVPLKSIVMPKTIESAVSSSDQTQPNDNGQNVAGEFLSEFTVYNAFSQEYDQVMKVLENIVRRWWKSHHFFPVYPEALDQISAKTSASDFPILASPQGKQLTKISTFLGCLDGQRVAGHLIYARKDAAKDTIFILSPQGWKETVD